MRGACGSPGAHRRRAARLSSACRDIRGRRPSPRVAMVVARRFAAVAARAGEKACSVRSQRVVQSPHPFGRRCPRHRLFPCFGHLSVDVVGADAGGAGHAVGCRAAGRCATPVRPICRRFPTLPGPGTRAALHRPGRARYAWTAQVVSTWGGPADCRWGPSSHRNPTEILLSSFYTRGWWLWACLLWPLLAASPRCANSGVSRRSMFQAKDRLHASLLAAGLSVHADALCARFVDLLAQPTRQERLRILQECGVSKVYACYSASQRPAGDCHPARTIQPAQNTPLTAPLRSSDID